MKTKVRIATVKAFRTSDPGQIAQLMREGEAINLPEPMHKTAADIAHTVQANMGDTHQAAEVIAAYVLRYAYQMNQRGQLVEAPPKPKRQRKQTGEGQK